MKAAAVPAPLTSLATAVWLQLVPRVGVGRRGRGRTVRVPAADSMPTRFGDSYRWPDGSWTHSA